MAKKIVLVRVKRDGCPPDLLRFFAVFQTPRFGYFPAKLRENALDIIRVPLKDISSTTYAVPLLKKILNFTRGVTPF